MSANKMIRLASKDDIKSLIKIEKECFTSPWTEAMLKSAFENEFNRFFVFICENEIAAYGGMTLLIEECEILNIAVRESFRRKKIAQSVLDELILSAKNAKAKAMFLEVNENNLPAIKLYEKNGFIAVGKRSNYYGADAALILKREM